MTPGTRCRTNSGHLRAAYPYGRRPTRVAGRVYRIAETALRDFLLENAGELAGRDVQLVRIINIMAGRDPGEQRPAGPVRAAGWEPPDPVDCPPVSRKVAPGLAHPRGIAIQGRTCFVGTVSAPPAFPPRRPQGP